jgi:hypothetical protein
MFAVAGVVTGGSSLRCQLLNRSTPEEASAPPLRDIRKRIMDLVGIVDFEPDVIGLDNDFRLVFSRVRSVSHDAVEFPLFLSTALSSSKLDTQELANFLQSMQDWVVADRAAVNKALPCIEVAKTEPTLAVAIARITYPVRDSLPNWKSYVQRLQVNLKAMNFNSEKILRGLI